MKIRNIALAVLAVGACAALVTAAGTRAGAKVGNMAPAISMPDTNGKTVSLADFKDKYVVLEWTNNGCPFVKRHYGSGNMQGLQKWAKDKGVAWLTIVSASQGAPGYVTADQGNAILKREKATPTALLLDTEGKIGREYGAKATPHMFVIDPKGVVIYNGAIDDKPTPDASANATAHNYVKAALEESMAGKQVSVPTSQPYGCGIHYKS